MTRPPPMRGAVLLIGAGRMGGALLDGWLAAARFAAIYVVEPKPSAALKRLAAAKKIFLSRRFVPESGIRYAACVLALKPQILKTEKHLLGALGTTGAVIVSIAAGVTTRSLAAALGKKTSIVRAMPNTPGAIGQGITALYAAGKLAKDQRNLAASLMAPLGQTLWVDKESAMDAVTAVSGSGPAYVFALVEALEAAARAEGLDAKAAERLARATVAGAGALLAAGHRSASDLRKDVTSPGGTTAAALAILMGKGGLAPLMRKAVAAAAKRSRELGA